MRSGALEIRINPEIGWPSSKIRKIAPEVHRAKMNRAATTVVFGRVKRLKLAKMMVSQNTNTTRKGLGIGLSVCAKSSKRVCAKSAKTCIARD